MANGTNTAEPTLEEIKANRAAWVAKLRSGDLPQTTGALHRTVTTVASGPVGYCCIGVACEVAIERGYTVERSTARASAPNLESFNDELGVAPDIVATVFGIDIWLNHTDTVESELINMNDQEYKSFAEIADFIEALPLPE